MGGVRDGLSKSLFIRGLQCHKSLYLHKHRPKLRDEISESQQRVFDSGTEVGVAARDLFPGGVEIPFDGLTPKEQLEKTAAALRNGMTTIYEAAFEHDGVFMKADILHKGARGWDLYEVKATTEVKKAHVNDVSLQYHVLLGARIDAASANVVHLNSQYVRKGAIEVNKLFVSEDITQAVRSRQTTVATEIAKMRGMLSGDTPPIDIGPYCNDPYPCDFQGHCWQHIPEDSVFVLRQRGARPFDFYRRGIVRLGDIPRDELSGAQLMQLEAFLNKSEFIDREELRGFLDSLWYPLYFVDFETMIFPIPPYDGMRPYQQLPFQYSLHYIEREGANLRHLEYLAEPNIDPRGEIAQRLVREIPKEACVLAYNASFEMGRLGDLAEYLPQLRERIAIMIDNMRDLIIPFRKRHVYSWRMKGSASQKAVLPALVPELSYNGMEIEHGGAAMDAYSAMCASDDPAEVTRIRAALLEYCKLDTLGMVRILEKLRELVA
jgi:hypothetical protein